MLNCIVTTLATHVRFIVYFRCCSVTFDGISSTTTYEMQLENCKKAFCGAVQRTQWLATRKKSHVHNFLKWDFHVLWQKMGERTQLPEKHNKQRRNGISLFRWYFLRWFSFTRTNINPNNPSKMCTIYPSNHVDRIHYTNTIGVHVILICEFSMLAFLCVSQLLLLLFVYLFFFFWLGSYHWEWPVLTSTKSVHIWLGNISNARVT